MLGAHPFIFEKGQSTEYSAVATSYSLKDWPMRRPQDWGQPCPNPAYSHRHCGNVRALTTSLPQGGQRRIFHCHTGEMRFAETRETVFCALRTTEEKGTMALQCAWSVRSWQA